MCLCNISDANNVPNGIIGIPLKGIINDDFNVNLTYAWCLNSDKVIAAFKAATGLDITIEDMPTLIKARNNANDLKLYNVNFNDIVKNIFFTDAEKRNASCLVNFTVKNLFK